MSAQLRSRIARLDPMKADCLMRLTRMRTMKSAPPRCRRTAAFWQALDHHRRSVAHAHRPVDAVMLADSFNPAADSEVNRHPPCSRTEDFLGWRHLQQHRRADPQSIRPSQQRHKRRAKPLGHSNERDLDAQRVESTVFFRATFEDSSDGVNYSFLWPRHRYGKHVDANGLRLVL